MKQKPSFSGDPANPYHPQSPETEAVKFLQNTCRRWLAGKATRDDVEEAISTWQDATLQQRRRADMEAL